MTDNLLPKITLFMLMSVDGKISTGIGNGRDFDVDLPKISGVSEGLNQYYELEKETDLWSLNSGAVQAKMGVNKSGLQPDKTLVNFVLIDNHHLTEDGVKYFIQRSNRFVLVTKNKSHPAFNIPADNMHIMFYNDYIDFRDMFQRLKSEYGCNAITVQTGGTLNGAFLREWLFHKLSIVVAPLLVGGKDTPTLIDGDSLQGFSHLMDLSALKLTKVTALKDSYLHLEYDVLDKTTCDFNHTNLF